MVNIDVNENELYKKYPRVLDLLLSDNTTRKNIIWATDFDELKSILNVKFKKPNFESKKN